MSDTAKRLLSGVILILLVIGLVRLGANYLLLFTSICGALVIDELLVNFVRLRRWSDINYKIAILFYTVFQALVLYFHKVEPLRLSITILGLILNILLLYLLCSPAPKMRNLQLILNKYPGLTALYVSVKLALVGFLVLDGELWLQKITLILVITYAMDTGAWFFGKNFGKHKLWPAVSPNKTVEGLVGGIFTSTILSNLLLSPLLNQKPTITTFIVFGVLALFSQLGDLSQSKIKRAYSLKDSSALIPGHGGLYDRVDSLLFSVPFFILYLMFA